MTGRLRGNSGQERWPDLNGYPSVSTPLRPVQRWSACSPDPLAAVRMGRFILGFTAASSGVILLAVGIVGATAIR